jgi:uncharacterized spore protein YtfJ
MFETVENLQNTASADAAFGDPKEVGERVLIPVACVRTGFGLGFGESTADQVGGEDDTPGDEPEGAGGGAAGGAGARPIAMIEVTPTETIVRPVMDEAKVALAGILLVAWIAFWVLATVRAVFSRQ